MMQDLKERAEDILSGKACHDDHEHYEACATCANLLGDVVKELQEREAKLVASLEKQTLKDKVKLARAQGLAQAIMDTAHWEDANKDGLRRTATEIAEILEEFLEEKDNE